MREMQLLHHHGADRRQELQTILPLVCGDGAAGLSGRMVPERAVRLGTGGSGTARIDVIARAQQIAILIASKHLKTRNSVFPIVFPIVPMGSTENKCFLMGNLKKSEMRFHPHKHWSKC